MKTRLGIFFSVLVTTSVPAQSVLFDFDNSAAHTPLPITLTVGGITAVFTGTAQGFAIQPANTLGFTPAGFGGNCIYPSSIFAADLRISFSQKITDFPILYAPEEYACDSSATMRVTAYLNGVNVGTTTTNAAAGTWPSETLAISVAQGFDSVVVHYDAPPVTGGDWGPIFMADNMRVTPLPAPIVLTNATMLPGSGFSFSFTNAPGGTFSVLAATNLIMATQDWTTLGSANEVSLGQYQFTDSAATNGAMQFYQVRSP
jgi:hypothetical protein